MIDSTDHNRDFTLKNKLLSLLPNSGVVTQYLNDSHKKIMMKKVKLFFSYLNQKDLELATEDIENDHFIYCFYNIICAVENSVKNEKIKLYSNFFSNAIRTKSFKDPEEYHFLLQILNTLSLKELKILRAIEKYEEKYYVDNQFGGPDYDDLGIRHEGRLMLFVEKELNLEENAMSDNELYGLINRLGRTGCYPTVGWRNGPALDVGLTNTYYKIRGLIQDI
jgi:hypothetical protein